MLDKESTNPQTFSEAEEARILLEVERRLNDEMENLAHMRVES